MRDAPVIRVSNANPSGGDVPRWVDAGVVPNSLLPSLATRPPKIMWGGSSQFFVPTVLVVESARLSRLRLPPEAVFHRTLDHCNGESGIIKRTARPKANHASAEMETFFGLHTPRTIACSNCLFFEVSTTYAHGHLFRALGAGSLCRISKERARTVEARGGSRRSACYESLFSISQIDNQGSGLSTPGL